MCLEREREQKVSQLYHCFSNLLNPDSKDLQWKQICVRILLYVSWYFTVSLLVLSEVSKKFLIINREGALGTVTTVGLGTVNTK